MKEYLLKSFVIPLRRLSVIGNVLPEVSFPTAKSEPEAETRYPRRQRSDTKEPNGLRNVSGSTGGSPVPKLLTDTFQRSLSSPPPRGPWEGEPASDPETQPKGADLG